MSGLCLSRRAGRHRRGEAARGRRAHSRQDQSRSVRDRPRRRALALRHRRAICSTRSSSRADRAPARRSRSPPASCRWRSAPTPPDRAACRPRFNNIVGLKPSRGLVSTAGVVPACRTLDCVSVFALTVDDAMATLNVIAGADAADPYSRPRPMRAGRPDAGRRASSACRCRANACSSATRLSAAAYDAALARLAGLGAKIVEIDIEPFYAAARLLYEGPWVAERYLIAKALIASSPEAMHPVTRQIILAGAHGTAADAFAALLSARRAAARARSHFPRASMRWCCRRRRPSIRSSRCWPIRSQLNSRLGTYTNFVNLLDLCGLAVPASMRPDGLPFGVTLLAPAGEDAALAAIGRQFHHATGLPLGALKYPQPPLAETPAAPAAGEIMHRRGRCASLRHAAQRRIARCRRRGSSRAPRQRRIIGFMRLPAPSRRSPACCG